MAVLVTRADGEMGQCNAFAITEDLLLTANHCLAEGRQFSLHYEHGVVVPEILTRKGDLAIIRCVDCEPLRPFTRSQQVVYPGQRVWAYSLTDHRGAYMVMEHIVILVNPDGVKFRPGFLFGSSGSPIVDEAGEVVGVVSTTHVQERSFITFGGSETQRTLAELWGE